MDLAATCPNDDLIAEFVHGMLPEREASAIEAHASSCPSCQQLLRELVYLSSPPAPPSASTDHGRVLWATPDAAPAPPLRLGRYEIKDRIGAGGMGVVLAAYDPELAREVSIKLLRPMSRDPGARRARLLREAQLMARLSHQHVCAVHDVGMFAGQVFVVMELVEGGTLRRWLTTSIRSWRDICDAFVAAAQGLAAAHAIGIVHRDFKPDNVLVGRDGRIRVTDFGLARAGDEADSDAGTLVGTLAYMAPEQRARADATARSDQYALCVALKQALGTRAIPRFLRRAIECGLAENPAARFASMDALVVALTPDRRRTVLPMALVAGLMTVAAVVSAVVVHRRGQPGVICAGSAGELTGVWDAGRRQTLHDAFARSGSSFASASFGTVAARLDGWASDWVRLRREACEANVRGGQSSMLMDVRLSCLDTRRAEVRALGEIFTHGDAKTLRNAVAAVYGLTPVTECADLALATRPPPPTDPALRAKFQSIAAEVARVSALDNAGRYAEGRTLAEQAVAEARAAHLDASLADALVALGRLQDRLGDSKTAEATLRDAGRTAEAARADDTLVRARLQLLWVVGLSLGRFPELKNLEADATAAIARAGNDELQLAGLWHRVGGVQNHAGDYLASRASLERAAEIRGRRLGDDPDLASTLNTLGTVYMLLGRSDDAQRTLERALAIRERLLGKTHPQVGSTLQNLGTLAMQRGDNDRAVALFERALAVMEPSLGAVHPDVATVLGNLATVRVALGQDEEAIKSAQRALAIRQKLSPDPTLQTGLAAYQLGSAYFSAHLRDDAARYFRLAADIDRQAGGVDHPNYGKDLSALGDLSFTRHQLDEALSYHQGALTVATHSLGADNPELGRFLMRIGRDEEARGRPDAATAPLKKALQLQADSQGKARDGVDPFDLADTQFALAVALGATGELGRARQLAAAAGTAYRAAGPGAHEQLADIVAWQATHGHAAP